MVKGIEKKQSLKWIIHVYLQILERNVKISICVIILFSTFLLFLYRLEFFSL